MVKIDTKCLKSVNNTFWGNVRPTLGPSISGTKCDRDKWIMQKEGVDQFVLRYKIGTQSD